MWRFPEAIVSRQCVSYQSSKTSSRKSRNCVFKQRVSSLTSRRGEREPKPFTKSVTCYFKACAFNLTSSIRKSRYPIEGCLRELSKVKDRENDQLKKERAEKLVSFRSHLQYFRLTNTRWFRRSIYERLWALGYYDEDFLTRFDPEGWHHGRKWRQLLEQTRAVSERGSHASFQIFKARSLICGLFFGKYGRTSGPN